MTSCLMSSKNELRELISDLLSGESLKEARGGAKSSVTDVEFGGILRVWGGVSDI